MRQIRTTIRSPDSNQPASGSQTQELPGPVWLLFIVGSLAAIALSAWHPPEPGAATMASKGGAWFIMHLTGGIGFLLCGAAALVLLVATRPNPLQATAYGFMLIGGIFTATSFTVDGSMGTALAPSVALEGPTPLWDLMYHFERAFMTMGLGLFAIGAGIYMAHERSTAGRAFRWFSTLAFLGPIGMFGAGVLYVGFKVPVGPLFALMPITFVWLLVLGVRAVVRPTRAAASETGAAPT